MRRFILSLILVSCTNLFSQDGDGNVTFENFNIPNTPAFILMDEAPTIIQRPNSTRAFALDILQNIEEDGVLDNIGVEVTPFWMIKRNERMNPLNFYGIKNEDGKTGKKQNIFSKLRLASVSAAYVKTSDSITNVSLGVRTTLLELKRKDDIDAYMTTLGNAQDLLSKFADIQEEYSNQINHLEPKKEDFFSQEGQSKVISSNLLEYEQFTRPQRRDFETDAEFTSALDQFEMERNAWIEKKCQEAFDRAVQEFVIEYKKYQDPEPDNYNTTEELDAARKEFRAKRQEWVAQRKKETGLTAELKENKEAFRDIVNRKPLLALDLAAAYNHRFFSTTFNDNGAGRFGIWSTFTLSSYLSQNNKTDYLNIYAFFRYLDETNRGMVPIGMDDRFNAFDIGVKGELEFNKLSVGYEYINRTGDMEGYRSAGTIKYELLNDVYLTGSFGNNFSETDDLISLFGIKWGINSKLQSMDISAIE